MTKARHLVCALCLALSGCEGLIAASSPPTGGTDDPALPGPNDPIPPTREKHQFQCDATAAAAPTVPLIRLSRVEYLNTVTDLVRKANPTDADAVLAEIAPLLDRVPRDAKVGAPGERRGGFSVADQSIQQALVDSTYEVAVGLGRALTSTSARRAALLGACATDTSTMNDASCLSDFVKRFGARVYRRPLDTADVTQLTAVATSAPVSAANLADVVALLFTAPQLMFFVEHGADDAAETAPLSAFELASRLSYFFWRTGPDDALWESAANGELLTPAGLQAQVKRLAESERATETYAQFFAEWFALDEIEEFDGLNTTPAFKTLAGPDLPNADTREMAIDDVVQMVRWSVPRGASLSTLITENRSFTRDPLLAKLYGAAVWAEGMTPPSPSSTDRAGLLTRIAFLSSGGLNTRPILKGARIRNSLMCENLQLPPGNVAAVAPKPSPTDTTRKVVETLTESSQNCAQCHRTLINPLGFSTEGFDALGRSRATELLFDEQGQKVGEQPVDTRTKPMLLGSDDESMSEGPGDLTRMLDESGRMHSCFARQYFRFVHRRTEDVPLDGCALAELETAALDGADLQTLFQKPALRPEFGTRSFK